MNPLILKILAVGLTLSQIFTKPIDQFKGKFDLNADQAEAQSLLSDGCRFVMKEFSADDEDQDLDFIFDLMLQNATNAKNKTQETSTPASATSSSISFAEKLTKQLDIKGLQSIYRTFCKGEKIDSNVLNMQELLTFYNNAMGDLPDHTKLKGMKLPEASILLDKDDKKFTEIYSADNRRRWVAVKDLPPYVKYAFVSAEDQRYFKHNGIDIAGILRAFSSNLSSSDSSRPQGGSTITQQVVKNLLVGDDLTFERKMREMVLAVRLEKTLSKDEILELYLNYVFLGRASWGIEMGSLSYFGKSAKNLSPAEAAFLAGMTRGPNFYHPERHPDRALKRRTYVINRMRDDKYLTDEQADAALSTPLKIVRYEPPRTIGGFYFIDEINRQAKKIANVPSLTSGFYTVYSTLNSRLQKATDRALQNGLWDYESQAGRASFYGPEGSLASDIEKYNTSWQELLPKARTKLFDVQWPLAVVVQPAKRTVYDKTTKRSYVTSGAVKVGLEDGRILTLSASSAALARLKLYDLIFVEVVGNDDNARANLRVPPTVQGSAIVIENKTGKVLAMSGGFSYGQSQLNRATQTARQTGSTLKPFIYLSALNLGYQPNTLIPNAPISLPPINRGGRWWSPKNYDRDTGGMVTIRQAIERSLNLPTVRMMAEMGSKGKNPAEGLDYIQGITKEIGIYKQTERVYPFVLGAQPARLIDMAVAYATIANDGLKPMPQFIDKMVQNGRVIYERQRFNLQPLRSVDRVAFYQLRRILEGTVVRGTAVRIKRWAGSVAGKTGTSNGENDAWFCGFTTDITTCVWVGYDSRRVRSSLGSGFTGGRVALPIAEKIFEASFEILNERRPLAIAPQDIRDQIYEAFLNNVRAWGSVDVFRVDKVSRPSQHTEYSPLNSPEVAALPQPNFDYGIQNTNPEDEDLLDEEYYQPPQVENVPASDYYIPGAENPNDLWRERNRQVEPIFAQPVFFKSNEEQ